jgi:hypothetical protein
MYDNNEVRQPYHLKHVNTQAARQTGITNAHCIWRIQTAQPHSSFGATTQDSVVQCPHLSARTNSARHAQHMTRCIAFLIAV